MYIAQAFKSNYSFWKYLIIPGGFIGLLVLNFLAIQLLNMDMETIIQSEIERKGSNRFLAEMLIPFAVGLVLLFGWVVLVHKQNLITLTTSRKKIDFKRILFAFGLWASITIVVTTIDYNLSPDDYLWNFEWSRFLPLAIIGLLLIPIQTSFEEYLFRGYLMQGIGVLVRNRWVPLVLTSVIFGLMHIANPEVGKIGYIIMVYYIGTGFFLGIMTLMDEGLELALGFHAANNLITALLVTANWTAFQTNSILIDVSEPAAGMDILIPVFIIFPILLFIFSKKYKWTDWKGKLFGKVEPIENEELEKVEA